MTAHKTSYLHHTCATNARRFGKTRKNREKTIPTHEGANRTANPATNRYDCTMNGEPN